MGGLGPRLRAVTLRCPNATRCPAGYTVNSPSCSTANWRNVERAGHRVCVCVCVSPLRFASVPRVLRHRSLPSTARRLGSSREKNRIRSAIPDIILSEPFLLLRFLSLSLSLFLVSCTLEAVVLWNLLTKHPNV